MNPSSSLAQNSEKERPIYELLESLDAGWDEHDALKIAALYAEQSSVLSSHSGKMFKGREAIKELLIEEHKTIMAATTRETDIVNINFYDDIAFMDATVEVSNENTGVIRFFRQVMLLKKINGVWKISEARAFEMEN